MSSSGATAALAESRRWGKLRSCATLFARVSPAGSEFHCLLDTCFDGKPEDRTLHLLAAPRR